MSEVRSHNLRPKDILGPVTRAKKRRSEVTKIVDQVPKRVSTGVQSVTIKVTKRVEGLKFGAAPKGREKCDR